MAQAKYGRDSKRAQNRAWDRTRTRWGRNFDHKSSAARTYKELIRRLQAWQSRLPKNSPYQNLDVTYVATLAKRYWGPLTRLIQRVMRRQYLLDRGYEFNHAQDFDMNYENNCSNSSGRGRRVHQESCDVPERIKSLEGRYERAEMKLGPDHPTVKLIQERLEDLQNYECEQTQWFTVSLQPSERGYYHSYTGDDDLERSMAELELLAEYRAKVSAVDVTANRLLKYLQKNEKLIRSKIVDETKLVVFLDATAIREQPVFDIDMPTKTWTPRAVRNDFAPTSSLSNQIRRRNWAVAAALRDDMERGQAIMGRMSGKLRFRFIEASTNINMHRGDDPKYLFAVQFDVALPKDVVRFDDPTERVRRAAGGWEKHRIGGILSIPVPDGDNNDLPHWRLHFDDPHGDLVGPGALSAVARKVKLSYGFDTMYYPYFHGHNADLDAVMDGDAQPGVISIDLEG